MYLLTKHKNKIATPVNLKPRRASCHFTTCVRRRGKEGVFSGFQDSRPSVQESSHYYIRLTHVLLNGPKRRKTYYAVCVFYNYVLLCMVFLQSRGYGLGLYINKNTLYTVFYKTTVITWLKGTNQTLVFLCEESMSTQMLS